MTEYYEPQTLDEACELVQRFGEDGKVLAGGTALVLFMRQGLLTPEVLINVQHVTDLAGIRGDPRPDGAAGHDASTPHSALRSPPLRIGALTTHATAARSDLIRQQYPSLAETFARVATPRIRNAGTIGGNLAHGDPHLDPPVTLLALDAKVTAQSARGRREIPLSEFFRDYYETALAPDEILTSVLVPPPPPRCGMSFIKFLPRSQDDYATVDIAVWLQLSADGDPHSARIDDIRIALGSVAPTAFRPAAAESLLKGQAIASDTEDQQGDDLLAEAGQRAAAACDPEDDVRGSAAYKRAIVKVLVRRAVRQALANAAT